MGAADLRIDLGRLRRDIEALAAIGRDPTGGISRPAWSPAHEEARAWLLGRLRAPGWPRAWIRRATSSAGSARGPRWS